MAKQKASARDVRKNPWTEAEIRGNMFNDPRWLVRGLLAIYRQQTELEKAQETTLVDNGRGFNGCDGKVLTTRAKRIVQGLKLADSDWRILRKRMPKYAGQLARIANGQLSKAGGSQ